MSYAIYQYFQNGGKDAVIVRVDEDSLKAGIIGDLKSKTGIYALENIYWFNFLYIPPPYGSDNETTFRHVYTKALEYCKKRRAMLIVDPPKKWDNKDTAIDVNFGIDSNCFEPKRDPNAVIFFPCIIAVDPMDNNRLREFTPCGAVAGVIARMDEQRGIWKAPVGIEVTLVGVANLTVQLTDNENAELNSLGINCLRIKNGYKVTVLGVLVPCMAMIALTVSGSIFLSVD